MVSSEDFPSELIVSTDPMLLDMPWILSRLKSAKGAKWRKDEQIVVAIQNSLCFGAYLPGSDEHNLHQVGFARVVTDKGIFSSVMDVMVDKDHRLNGYGSRIMTAIIGHPEIFSTVCILSTLWADVPNKAKGFYAKFGFEEICGGIMIRSPIES